MKKQIILICGGRSAEHAVSIISTASVLESLDKSKFEVTVIGISKQGGTLTRAQLIEILPADLSEVRIPDLEDWIAYLGHLDSRNAVVFPVLHGPYGEDGTIQGLLELLNLPYVGAGVCGSAVAMNKIHCKSILKAHGIPVLPAVYFRGEEWNQEKPQIRDRIKTEIQYPLFIKPANMGSSIGVSKCETAGQLESAVENALQYDGLVFAETGVDAREIEVSVLGGNPPSASCPGEIIPGGEFYSYEAKYLDESSELVIPAELPVGLIESIRQLACRVFQVLQLEGMARVDFLLEKKNSRIWVNEPNTIPGFTPISMYPKLWEATGIPYPELLERLINLGIERHQLRSEISVNR